MKKFLIVTTALCIASPVLAQTPAAQDFSNPTIAAPAAATPQTDPVAPDAPAAVPVDPVLDALVPLQAEWARIKYQIADDDQRLEAIHALENRATAFSAQYPDRAEPKIWEGIILSTDAGIVKGLSALGKVKKAKALLEAAIQQNPSALEGSAYTSLGSLYYQVPGWPVGFGDDEKAEANLRQALQLNPNGIDPNYFYGDFLMQQKRYGEATSYFQHGLEAPDRAGRELADAGRRQEIRAALAKIEQKADTAVSHNMRR